MKKGPIQATLPYPQNHTVPKMKVQIYPICADTIREVANFSGRKK